MLPGHFLCCDLGKINMKRHQTTMILIAICLLVGCAPPAAENGTSSSAPEITVGGLYSIQNNDDTFSVMKVLAVDDFIVHIRSYANKFTENPVDVDPEVLTLGGLNDPAGIGIGHSPLAKEGFINENPVFIKQVPVTDEELEGYRIYLEAMNGSQ